LSGLKPGPISEATARAKATTNTGALRFAPDDDEQRQRQDKNNGNDKNNSNGKNNGNGKGKGNGEN
jgi:hypothetical protein